LRKRVAEQHERLIGMRRLDYFIERVDLPEDGLDAEWDAYVAYGAGMDARVEQLTATALDRFDAENGGDSDTEAAFKSKDLHVRPDEGR